VACAFVVFLLTGMNAPEVRAEMEHARKGELLAKKLSQGTLSRVLINGGKLQWRILMLVVLLAAIALPLRTAFKQVASEAIVRGTVHDVVKGLLPPGTIVSQRVEVGRESVAVRLISTQTVPEDKIRKAEQAIEKRSGRKGVLSIASIASQSELSELMQRISTPEQSAQKTSVEPLEDIHKELIVCIKPILTGIWPPEAPLLDFSVAFDATGIVFNVQYESAHGLGKISQDILVRELRDKLGTQNITLVTRRVAPSRTAARRTKH
jgi:hypothetical protein